MIWQVRFERRSKCEKESDCEDSSEDELESSNSSEYKETQGTKVAYSVDFFNFNSDSHKKIIPFELVEVETLPETSRLMY